MVGRVLMKIKISNQKFKKGMVPCFHMQLSIEYLEASHLKAEEVRRTDEFLGRCEANGCLVAE